MPLCSLSPPSRKASPASSVAILSMPPETSGEPTTTASATPIWGFDTLIMGMRNADALRALFEIPENEMILAVIALGYRAEDPSTPVHRPLDEIAKFF